MSRILYAFFLLVLTCTLSLAEIIGADNRKSLEVLRRSPDQAEQELARSAKASGWLLCNNGLVASASLVAHPQIIVTAAHVFNYARLHKPQDHPLNCQFQLNASEKFDIDMSSLIQGAQDIKGYNICSSGRDWAVAKLKTAATVSPYHLASSVPKVDTPLLSIAHSVGQPTATLCRIKDHIGPCQQTRIPLLYTDCDSENGSSGGAILVFEAGLWRLAAITRGASPKGGLVYDKKTAYHMAIPLDGAPRVAIQKLWRQLQN